MSSLSSTSLRRLCRPGWIATSSAQTTPIFARAERHVDDVAGRKLHARRERGRNRPDRARPAPAHRQSAGPCGEMSADSARLRKGEESSQLRLLSPAMNAPNKHQMLSPPPPDVAAEIARWLAHLGAERRMSAKTRRSLSSATYAVPAFPGGASRRRANAARSSRSWRRRTCAPSWRRAAPSGIGGRSLMRGLAGARSFARFLERNGKGKVGALAAVRAPKVPKTLPKPLAIGAAQASPMPICAPAKTASHGCWPATLRCSRCFTARACASPKRSASNAATCRRPAAATPSR